MVTSVAAAKPARLRCCLAAVLLVALCTSPAVVSAQQNADPPAATPPNEQAVADDLGLEMPEQPQADAGTSWAARLDAFFGKYIVNPLLAVLFYDFGTGDKIVDGEVVHQGWLVVGGDAVSVPFVVAWLFAGGLFFTLRMGFINFRGFWHAIRLTKGDYDDPADVGEVSHFQALASALSATVGLGNIAGVAIAVGTGGPGAVFWIIVIGLLGMSSKFSECTLGQMYRKRLPDGTISGGPMHYLSEGLAEKGHPTFGLVLATMFAVFCILASFGGGNTFQVVQSLGAVNHYLVEEHQSNFLSPDGSPWVYGLIMAVMVGVVIIGGIRRIGAAASKIVPLMCCVYVATALYILLSQRQRDSGRASNSSCDRPFRARAWAVDSSACW